MKESGENAGVLKGCVHCVVVGHRGVMVPLQQKEGFGEKGEDFSLKEDPSGKRSLGMRGEVFVHRGRVVRPFTRGVPQEARVKKYSREKGDIARVNWGIKD